MTDRERAVIDAAEKLIAAVSVMIPERRYQGGYADDRSEQIEVIRAARDELRAALDSPDKPLLPPASEIHAHLTRNQRERAMLRDLLRLTMENPGA